MQIKLILSVANLAEVCTPSEKALDLVIGHFDRSNGVHGRANEVCGQGALLDLGTQQIFQLPQLVCVQRLGV